MIGTFQSRWSQKRSKKKFFGPTATGEGRGAGVTIYLKRCLTLLDFVRVCHAFLNQMDSELQMRSAEMSTNRLMNYLVFLLKKQLKTNSLIDY